MQSESHAAQLSSRCQAGMRARQAYRVSSGLYMGDRQVVANIEEFIGGGGTTPQGISGGLRIEGLS